MNKVVLDNIKVIKNHPDFKESMYMDPLLKNITGEIAYYTFFSNSKHDTSDMIDKAADLMHRAFYLLINSPWFGLKILLFGDDFACRHLLSSYEKDLHKVDKDYKNKVRGII